MNIRSANLFLILSLFIGAFARAQTPAPCTQILSPGANLAQAVASAPSEAVLCLSSGKYGSVDFAGIKRTTYVTIRSQVDRGAVLSPQLSGSSFLRFSNLTIEGSTISACASNIQIKNSTFTSGLLVNMRGSACANFPLNISIDGNTFTNVGPALFEGRISVADDDGPQPSMGLSITNNLINGSCNSDGVQVVGGASGVKIGPGNIFSDIIQTSTTQVHCDSIQFYGSGQNNVVTGNWFKNVSVAIQHQGGTPNGTQFTHNLLTNVDQVSIGGSANLVFSHNTLNNVELVRFGNSSDLCTNLQFQNNLLMGTTGAPYILSATTGTFSHNLCASVDQCFGTDQKIGTPTFIGGAIPTTWSGYQLTSTSIGYKNGSDGQDRGINFYGSGSSDSTTPGSLQLQPPKNLRIQ